MKTTRSLLAIALLLCTNFLFAQEKSTTNPSIDQQFDELIKTSNNYKQYEVVRKSSLVELQNNTQEVINGLQKEISTYKSDIGGHEKEMAKINASLTETSQKLKEVTKSKQEISFFGIPTNKTTYKTIMWGIVLILLFGLVFFIYKFKNSNVLTAEAQKDLQTLKEEFDEYRKSALEKQQKLGRMLQDERNKLQRHNEK